MVYIVISLITAKARRAVKTKKKKKGSGVKLAFDPWARQRDQRMLFFPEVVRSRETNKKLRERFKLNSGK